ncbi:hypothetical protein D1872_300370 [compost metagenome]
MIYERVNAILLRLGRMLFFHQFPNPARRLTCLFEVETPRVQNFMRINSPMRRSDQFGCRLHRAERLLQLEQFLFRHQITFVQDQYIAKLDLIGQQVHDPPRISFTGFLAAIHQRLP